MVGAALESIARRPCLTTFDAYRQGRSAAIDEFRRLTGGRTLVRGRSTARKVRLESLDETVGGWATDRRRPFDEVDAADAIDRWSAGFSRRERRVVTGLAGGATHREIASDLDVHPSRVSQLLRPIKDAGPRSLRAACA